MPELKPCPNPKCMGKAPIIKEGARIDIVCPNCLLALPAPLGSLEWLVDQWNALPRALTWTTEPPKVPGWYWFSVCKGHAVCILVCADGKAKLAKDHFTDAELLGGEWAGPIPTPLEPGES